jgi:EAL domain-containing protein (putative c-di-GMP-specific phosphodiesterase class I)
LFSLEEKNINDYLDIEEKIDSFLRQLKILIRKAGYSYILKINIGASIYPEHAEDAESLLSKAHHAMSLIDHYSDNFKIYNEDMFLEKLYYESLKKDLEKAIEKNQLFLEFQPKVDSFTEEIVAAEALLRWYHPEKGLIPPNEFIPMAVKSRFIKKIGVWVLKEAFELLERWCKEGHNCIKICVNISPCELNDPEIINEIEEIANSYNVPNNLIEFEITERTVANVPEEIMDRLKKLGFWLVLDDFGTGYSSLSYFGRLPVDILKLDKSFISDINKWKTRTLVETVINLSHEFDVEVVAEGIENEDHLEILRELKCDYIQGYYFYKPMAEEKLLKLLNKESIKVN